MQKVLVTGATGFIGNYIVEELLKRNCKVVTSSPNEQNARRKSWFSRTEYRPLDIQYANGEKDYYQYFDRPDLMIHLGWQGLPNYNDSIHTEQNLPVHKVFLENMIRNGLKNLNITGTCFEYGMREGKLSESMEAMPANQYAIAKNELRKFVEDLKKVYSFDYKWIRLFYMYGQGQNSKSLLSQLQQALDNHDQVFNMSGGEQTRDFLPVEKVAEYIVDIALQTKVEGIINCCSGLPVTVKQIVLDYLNARNASLTLNLGHYPYPSYEPMHFWGDNSRLMQIIHNKNIN